MQDVRKELDSIQTQVTDEQLKALKEEGVDALNLKLETLQETLDGRISGLEEVRGLWPIWRG